MEKDKGNSPKIIGNGHIRYTEYIRDDDTGEFIEVLKYRGEVYRLDEFMPVHNFYNPNPPAWLRKFDGYLNDSYFSGILLKYDTEYGDGYKVYTFIS